MAFLFFAIGLSLISQAFSQTSNSYLGAVVEHEIFMGSDSDTNDYKLTVNLNLYSNLTSLAKSKNAQILVFPEFGLNPTSDDSRESLYPYAEKIGNVENNNIESASIPCIDPSFSDKPILRTMSCSARDNKLALLVNMVDWIDCDNSTDKNCPTDSHYQYNTDVIFDESGRLLVKYHKSHEFPGLRKAYDQVPEPSEVVYKSSFGVNFGVFTCFDIMFPDPPKKLRESGIEHFLYPVSQGQIGEDTIISGWSKNNQAVLLSANLGAGQPKGDCSGILKNGESLSSEKYYLDIKSTKDNLLIASIPF